MADAFHIRGIHKLHFSFFSTFDCNRNCQGDTPREGARLMLVAPQLRFFAGYKQGTPNASDRLQWSSRSCTGAASAGYPANAAERDREG